MAIDQQTIEEWAFDLILRREILEEFENELIGLARLCQTEAEFELVRHTAENLVALSNAQYNKKLISMAKHIREVSEKSNEVAVIAMAWDEKPDSSQKLLQQIKIKFRRDKKFTFYNSVPAFIKKKKYEKHDKYILIDDFSGTGNTIKTRYEYITNHVKAESYKIEHHVCIMYGMESALKRLTDEAIDAVFLTSLKAGISGYFTGQQRVDRISQMQRIETNLAPHWDGDDLPSLGYGSAEALFFIINENAPNSNFPIYWWPKDIDGNDRITIMHRA